jgi:hypothetical protein
VAFEKIDLSDRAVLAWQQLGNGKTTPENRVLLRFHTASVVNRPPFSMPERSSRLRRPRGCCKTQEFRNAPVSAIRFDDVKVDYAYNCPD